MSKRKPTCAGPVYFGDQGIEYCETCGGCICCDFESVDHTATEYRCAIGRDGKCHLLAHADRPCTTTPPDAAEGATEA